MNPKKLIVVAHNNLGASLSGGDRIFLNLIKYWQSKTKITVLASPEASNLINRFKLSPKIIITSNQSPVHTLNTSYLVFHHLSRFLSAILFCLKNKSIFKSNQYLYTASDFYGDFVFGLFAKIYHPSIKWICGYYLLAPNPLSASSPYRHNHQYFRGIIYFLAQKPTILLTKLFADFLFVTSNPDVKIFQSRRLTINKIFVIKGGVNLPSLSSIRRLKPISNRLYDAVFLGRLHAQKGVVELIDIWKIVVNQLPEAKLVIIGDGEMLSAIKQKISKLQLTKNIKLAGFMLGHKKFNIIKNSKIVVHPATYDSGGMAAAEAMAWGLPGVSFDLPALKTYYPQGMVKTNCFSKKQFASNIIKLLTSHDLYTQYSSQALNLTRQHWSWHRLFNRLSKSIFSL